MFNLGFTEMLAIAVIALVVIGPKQLPQVARVIGRVLGEFRRASSDFNREIYRAQENFQHQVSNVEEHLDVSGQAAERREQERKTQAENEAIESKQSRRRDS